MKYFLPFLIGALCVACAASKQRSDKEGDLGKLRNFMTGTFNSAAQAERDTDYFDITLHMYPIWTNQAGYWLYVEQAVTANQAKPYRQRVYQLEQVDRNTFKSSVYTLKKEKEFINAWQTPDKFKALTINDIELKAGCEVVLKKQKDGTFSGATDERTCPSELRGAKYATSRVTVFPDKILSWDQGFDEAGKQVWGAVKGGYEFLKVKQ